MRNRSQFSWLLVLAFGCGDNNSVGSPCDKDEQCGEGLVCDVHDGKGTCQEPHDHGSAGETQAPTSGTTHATEGHGTTAGTTGPDAAVCADYCACLEAHCEQHDQFPHADVAACETACVGFSAEQGDCWIPFCELAARGDNGQLHYCEHASGSIGLAECG